MSDSNKTLPLGLGLPLVDMMDGDKVSWQFSYEDEYGNPQVKLFNDFITSFEYTYDEENDDVCKITLQFDGMLQATGAYLSKDTILNVRWGYKLQAGEVVYGPIRKVAIRNSDYHYTADKIYAVLDCTDLFSYARNLKVNFTSDRDYFEEWLGEIVSGTFVATIDNGDTLTMISQKGQKVTVLNKYTRAITQDITEETTIMKAWTTENITKGHSKAITAHLEELIQKAEDGPYYIEGRDGIVNVFKRDFNQPAIYSWTLQRENGELISFVSKTNLKLEKLDEAESSTINPDTKEMESTSSNYITDEGKTDVTEEELKAAAKLARKVYDWNLKHPKNQKTFNGFTIKRSQYRELPDAGLESSWELQDGIIKSPFARKRFGILSVSAKEIMSTPGYTQAFREASLDNYVLKKLERRYTATAVVIGEPQLKTSRVYSFPNLMPHEAGNWYCSKCTHKITQSAGYVTTMELLRKSDDLGIVRKRLKTKYTEDTAPKGTTNVNTTDNNKVKADNEVTESIEQKVKLPTVVENMKPSDLRTYLSASFIQAEEYKKQKDEEEALIEQAFIGQEAWEASKVDKTEANIFQSTSRGYSQEQINNIKKAADDYK